MAAAERSPRRLVSGGLPIVYRELTCSCVSGTTAGLRQPLLIARRALPAKWAICDAESHMRQERRASAPVGSGTALATATWHSSENLRAAARSSERQPAVGSGNALATATWHSSENLRAGTRSGDRQPAVGSGNASAAAIAHTPAAIDCYTRAGGVSPPWFCKPHVQRKRLEFRVSGSHAECVPRAASTPAPGAVTTTVRRKKDDLCDAQTHFHRSGDRQPAVVR
jgi:hypothetical protein